MSEALAQHIVAAFNASAATYDQATPLQRQVAQALVARIAAQLPQLPRQILDLGAGAGHVTEAARKNWPQAEIAALDAAPAMLAQLQAKSPEVRIICADARHLPELPAPDLILSSMMLHWLDQPQNVLANWLKILPPGGAMAVALPVEGTFSEWRALLQAEGFQDGLWEFPAENFAKQLDFASEIVEFPHEFANISAFLASLKRSGAHKSRPGAKNLTAGALRRLLAAHPGPFIARFRVAFLLKA